MQLVMQSIIFQFNIAKKGGKTFNFFNQNEIYAKDVLYATKYVRVLYTE